MSTPFLPPSRPDASTVAPFPAPKAVSWTPPTAVTPSFTLVDPPRRRRRRVGFVIGAALVVAGAATTAVVVSGGRPAAAGYSLTAATAEAAAADTATMHLTMSMGSLGTVEGDLVIDNDAQRMQASVSVAGSSTTVVFDSAASTAYVQLPDALGGSDDQWMQLDLGDLGGLGGLGDSPLSNPLDVAPLFEHASSVQDLGLVDVDGRSLKHYQVGIDLADVTAKLPELPASLDLPDTLTYDVFVDGGGSLRKLSFSLDALGETATYDITITDLGGPVDIEIPSPDHVVSMGDALGGLLGGSFSDALGSLGG